MIYQHIMLDLETLGTQADAIILSIGACKFNLDGSMDDRAFYAACLPESQPNRHMSYDTLRWWLGQGDEAKRVFTDPNAIDLYTALVNFNAWFNHESDEPEYMLWSNGADFDIPIMTHAMRQMHVEKASNWKFYLHRCFRTIKNEYPKVPKPLYEGAQHNALVDAIQQAKWLQAIYQQKENPTGFAVKRP